MRKTIFSIQKEAEMVRRVLVPSKRIILHMWMPCSFPVKDGPKTRRVILVPLKEEERLDPRD
jgi:hypothetical protein